MQAIEFDAVPEQHNIRVPDGVPDGVPVRDVLLWEPPADEDDAALKRLIASVTEGLTDADLERPRDMGRRDQEWDT